jgi:probable rRNA maturation factor
MSETKLEPDPPLASDTQPNSEPDLEPESLASERAAALWQSKAGNVIEVSFDPVLWDENILGSFATTATQLLDHIDLEFGLGAENAGNRSSGVNVGMLLCGDARMQTLNHDFRGKDQATNVLSFPNADDGVPDGVPDGVSDTSLGDIAIAFETIAREAQALGISQHDHVAHMFVHGVIHLLGYDHLNDEDANEMEAIEIDILRTVSITNPYEIASDNIDNIAEQAGTGEA